MTLTQRGAGLLAAAIALLSAGFGFGYPELTVIGTAALVAMGFAVAYAAWRPKLAVTRSVDPDRVMRGESSRVSLNVRNVSRLRGATLIAHDRCGARTVPVPLLRLGAGRRTTVDYPVPTERRGLVRVGPLRVVRRDPLGLLTLARSHGGTDQVWVYPKVYPLSAVPVGIVRSLDGRVDRVPHGTITFDTLREYVIGDELRHVHWRTTARVGELMVREHVDTSLPRLVVLLDNRRDRYADPEHFEHACEAAASIVVAAVRAELPIVLQLTHGGSAGGDGRQRPGSAGGRDHLDLLAEATLTETSDPAADLVETVARLRHRRLGDTLIYLTGVALPEDLGHIGTLRGGYPSIVVGALGGSLVPLSAVEGLLVLPATDGEDFAHAWDGVKAW